MTPPPSEINKYFIDGPDCTYTCVSSEDFPIKNFTRPTMHWDKGYWKDVLDLMPNLKGDYAQNGLNYICDAFAVFKIENEIEEMKNIFSVLSDKLSTLLNSWKDDVSHAIHWHTITLLINNNKDIIKLLNEEVLKKYQEFLENLPKDLRRYLELARVEALGLVKNCLDLYSNKNESVNNRDESTGTNNKWLNFIHDAPTDTQTNTNLGTITPQTNISNNDTTNTSSPPKLKMTIYFNDQGINKEKVNKPNLDTVPDIRNNSRGHGNNN